MCAHIYRCSNPRCLALNFLYIVSLASQTLLRVRTFRTGMPRITCFVVHPFVTHNAVLYSRMPFCYCDICTRGGRCPQGSIQSATTVREHQHAQRLWHSHQYTTGHRMQMFHGWPSSWHTSTPRQGSPPRSPSDADLELRTVLDRVRGHILGFQLPVALVFAHPPRIAQSIYPVTSHSNSWCAGPSSLDVTDPQNASILEHILAIQSAHGQLQHLMLELGHSPSITLVTLSHVISTELARLEAFRQTMWNMQLEDNVSLATSPGNNYINNPTVCQTCMFDLRGPSPLDLQ